MLRNLGAGRGVLFAWQFIWEGSECNFDLPVAHQYHYQRTIDEKAGSSKKKEK